MKVAKLRSVTGGDTRRSETPGNSSIPPGPNLHFLKGFCLFPGWFSRRVQNLLNVAEDVLILGLKAGVLMASPVSKLRA